MRWLRSLWSMVILLGLYLVPMALHYDAVAALAGELGAWAFAGLYAAWGILLGVITAKRESATVFLLTLWPALLLLVTFMGALVATSFVVLVVYAVVFLLVALVLGAAAIRDLFDIAARRFEAQHLSTTQRLGFVLFFSIAFIPLAMCLSHQYERFGGASPGRASVWWLLYLDLLGDAGTFGLLTAVDMRLSGVTTGGFLDGGLWWLCRTLLDVVLAATLLDLLRSGRQRL